MFWFGWSKYVTVPTELDDNLLGEIKKQEKCNWRTRNI